MTSISFSFDTPEESPGFLLWQVSITWQRHIKDVLDPYGISHAQFVILAVLLWCEEAKKSPIQSFLVNKTKLDKMTVSAALKKLASLDLIKRHEHANDTRAKLVEMTCQGKKLTRKLVKQVEGIDKAFFSNLKKSDRQFLIHLFNEILNVSAHPF